jgi:hypothetical protein
MAGQVAGNQLHAEFQAEASGAVSGTQLHAEYQTQGSGAVSGTQLHVDYIAADAAAASLVVLMVEYRDVQNALIQGEFLLQLTQLQGACLTRGPGQITIP